MNSSPIDMDILLALEDLMGADFPLLLKTFQIDTAERLAKLQRACAQADRAQLHLTAHSLKGSSSNMGATELTELCRELELAADNQPLAVMEALVAQLQVQCARLDRALEVELQRLNA
ncbi:hypothetical protein AX279_20140 [Pseudomonas sp. J237]|nr:MULTISPECIES: Hpt domain-containing protein [Pseudomonas]OEO24136.1 hypothetical protein AX279_20140 [Pseudomonas sp. J237]